MNKPRGRPFTKGNTAAPGGHRPRAGRPPARLKVIMSDLLHQVMTSDKKKRTAAEIAFDTVCEAMLARDRKGIPTAMAVDVSKFLLPYVVGHPPKQEIDHNHSGSIAHDHVVKLKPIVINEPAL